MLKIARLVSLFLLALALGVSYSHLLQWNPKATLPASDFLKIQQILLSQYGTGIGWVEGFAVLVVAWVAFLVRNQKRQFALTLVAFICLIVMIGIWAIWINPINTTVNSWSATSVPDYWQNARDAWHQFHAIRFTLSVVALGTFAWSILDKGKPTP